MGCLHHRQPRSSESLVSDPAVNPNWVEAQKSDTPLHRACQFGHHQVVQVLLKHPQIDVNAQDAEEATPLFLASQKGHTEVVALLVADKRVDVNKPWWDGVTPLLMACQEGHLDVIRLLLVHPRISCNKADPVGYSPFFVACQFGHTGVVRLLLADMRINVNRGNFEGTPLRIAASIGRLAVVQLILKSGREGYSGFGPKRPCRRSKCSSREIEEILLKRKITSPSPPCLNLSPLTPQLLASG